MNSFVQFLLLFLIAWTLLYYMVKGVEAYALFEQAFPAQINWMVLIHNIFCFPIIDYISYLLNIMLKHHQSQHYLSWLAFKILSWWKLIGFFFYFYSAYCLLATFKNLLFLLIACYFYCF